MTKYQNLMFSIGLVLGLLTRQCATPVLAHDTTITSSDVARVIRALETIARNSDKCRQ